MLSSRAKPNLGSVSILGLETPYLSHAAPDIVGYGIVSVPPFTYLHASSLKWLGIVRVCQVGRPADQIRFVLRQIIQDFVRQIEGILHDLPARRFHN